MSAAPSEATPTRTCERCGGQLWELLGGIDACRTCGPRLDPVRRESERLSESLAKLERFVRRYVVLSDAQAIAIVLFAAHSYVVAGAEATPYLHLTSPEKRSGKTRALETLELVVANPLRAVNISEAALFRVIDDPKAPRPTLLFDEIDAIFGPRSDREELRGLLNAGYRRGAIALRADKTGAVHRFDAFCAKALAGIGDLPDTVADRCIAIRMQRRAPGELVARFRVREANDAAEPLRGALEAWATDEVIEALREARPAIPTELDDRAADGWEPLLAIADLAGEGWPEIARAAAVELAGGPSEDSLGGLILQHVADAFEGRDRIATHELLTALIDRPDGPWAVWWAADVEAGRTRGPASRLARLLHPFPAPDGQPIRSRKIRFGEGTRQGYVASDFSDAWSRYLRSGANPEMDRTTEPRRSDGVSAAKPESVETGADQGSSIVPANLGPNRERALVDGDAEPWRQLQRDAGEEPETDDAAALARVKVMIGAQEVPSEA